MATTTYAASLMAEHPTLSKTHAETAARLERTKATSQMTDIELAKVYAAHIGVSSREGGWIYSPTGAPIVQGWWQYAQILKNAGRIKVGSGINWKKA